MNKAICISLGANALGIGINTSLLCPTINSQENFSFGWATSLEEGNTLNSRPEECCSIESVV